MRIGLGQAVAGVPAGDAGNEAKMGENELPGRFQVLVVAELLGEVPLFVLGEHGNGVHRLEVRLEAAPRRDCEREFQCFAHGVDLPLVSACREV